MFGEVRLTSQDGTLVIAVPEGVSRTTLRITTLGVCLLENYVTRGAGGKWRRLLRVAKWI